MIYLFRNNTIEQFFGLDYVCSGYGDITNIPEADEYVWWYQIPLLCENPTEEIEFMKQQLGYVVSQLSSQKLLSIFTLVNLHYNQIEVGDTTLAERISEFNAFVYKLAQEHTNIRVVDFAEFVAQCGYVNIIDWRYYYTAQMPLNPKLIPAFKRWWKNKQNQNALKRKKCVVLDLDNTLWKGVLGEDGVYGVQLSGDYPGKAFHYWQHGLLKLRESGVMLAICSKNNAADVEELWAKRTDMVLKSSDFVAKRINWQDKANNLQSIAEELNIGLDSFVFVDDNPAERELIKQTLPMVAVPEFPEQPFELATFYQQLITDYFAVYKVTEEDRNKTKQYAANAARQEFAATFTNMEDYLSSLEIHLSIEVVNELTLPRVAQMTQKTNQFNLTTRRYTEADINHLLSLGAKIFTLSVKDKFGDNGITGCMIVTRDGVVDTLLLSCRILGRGIEKAFVKSVMSKVKADGAKHLIGTYIPTAKNMQVKDFWPTVGFAASRNLDDGSSEFTCNLDDVDLTIENYYIID